MKNQLNAHDISRHFLKLALTLSLALPLPSLATSVTLASSPLANSSTTTVSPNMMFMLDDSGSMAWDYMPDNALNFNVGYGFNSNHCNGVYYNPTITYTPPVTSTGISFPNSSFTAAPVNGYQYQAGTNLTTVNLNTSFKGGSGTGNSGASGSYTGPAFYYNYSGTQNQNYQMLYQNTSSIFYKECISTVGSTTKVDGTNPVNTVFSQVTLATTPTSYITVLAPPGATITLPSTTSTTTAVSKVIVNGIELLPTTTSSSKNGTTLAGYIAAGINACTTVNSGSCTGTSGTGVSATVSGSVITLYGNGTLGGYTPAVTNSTGNMTYTYTAFPTIASTYVSGITVNGVSISTSTASTTSSLTLATSIAASISPPRTATVSGNVVTITGLAADSLATPVITTATTSAGPPLTMTVTPFPDSNAADLQNFANWYSYYSIRMLMMKTGVGLAFAPIGGNYRVGFMTMNNNVAPDYVDIAPFTAAQKSAWYTKLYASSPANSTPLREALSHIGQLYAHKLGAYTTYTSTITVSGNTSTTVDNITVNGVSIMAGTATPSASSTTVASNVALQINIPVVSNYGAASTGNVITITSGLASDVGTYPVETDDGGGMTFTVTPFVANSVVAQLNGVTPADPIQYSCQQNFVILSTDGYWNGATTYDLNNNPVGNQDGTAPRPMYDGAAFTLSTSQTFQTVTQVTQTTSQVLKRTTQVQSSTSNLQNTTVNLQSSIANLQNTTVNLQSSTAALQSTAYALQSSTAALQSTAYALQSSTSALQQQVYPLMSSTAALQSTAYALQSSTSALQQQVYPLMSSTATLQSQAWQLQYSTNGGSTWTNGACTIKTSSPKMTCQYVAGTLSNVTSCTVSAKTTSTSNGTVYNAAAVTCGYTAYTAAAPAGSCTYQNESTASPYAGPAVTCSYNMSATPATTTVTTCT
ncbi:MAG: hypothetical protein WCA63_04050, partial [Gallionella sp.]